MAAPQSPIYCDFSKDLNQKIQSLQKTIQDVSILSLVTSQQRPSLKCIHYKILRNLLHQLRYNQYIKIAWYNMDF